MLSSKDACKRSCKVSDNGSRKNPSILEQVRQENREYRGGKDVTSCGNYNAQFLVLLAIAEQLERIADRLERGCFN